MRLTKIIFLTILASFLVIGNAFAVPFSNSGSALQSVFDSHTDGGSSSIDVIADEIDDDVDSIWESTATLTSASTIIVEIATYANTNTFGIYDPYNPMTSLQLFAGPESTGSSVSFQIFGNGDIFLDGYSTGETPDASFANDTFGYYLDVAATGNRFYSDTSLNSDQQDHMAAYQGVGDMFSINPSNLTYFPYKEWTPNEYILAWEDLIIPDGDEDFTDFVVMVESVQPVPEPATMLLLGTGLVGLAGFGRKRFFKKG